MSGGGKFGHYKKLVTSTMLRTIKTHQVGVYFLGMFGLMAYNIFKRETMFFLGKPFEIDAAYMKPYK